MGRVASKVVGAYSIEKEVGSPCQHFFRLIRVTTSSRYFTLGERDVTLTSFQHIRAIGTSVEEGARRPLGGVLDVLKYSVSSLAAMARLIAFSCFVRCLLFPRRRLQL